MMCDANNASLDQAGAALTAKIQLIAGDKGDENRENFVEC
jgi:hypothetical protein